MQRGFPDEPERLSELVSHALRTVPFYATIKPPEGGVLSHEFFASLPLLDRNTIKSNTAKLLSLEAQDEALSVARTTGTTGEPVTFYLDAAARAAERTELRKVIGSYAPGNTAYYHIVLVPYSESRAIPEITSGVPSFKWNLQNLWSLPDTEFGRRLSVLDNAVLAVMPSLFEAILQRLGDLEIHPALVILSGEDIADTLVSRARERLGCEVVGLYATTESGIVAVRCTSCGQYHPTESALIEILDDRGIECEAGIVGEIHLTPLANRAMVLLRYGTKDKARWADNKCFGRQAFELMAGRVPSLIDQGAVDLSGVVVSKVLAALPVRKAQLRAEDNHLVLLYENERPLDPRIMDWARASILNRLNFPTEIEFRSNAHSGKVKVPRGPTIGELSSWVREALQSAPCVLFTGSFINCFSRRADSDLDLTILVDSLQDVGRWIQPSKELRRQMPRLSIHVDAAQGLSSRSPLVSCRLLAEASHIVGSPTQMGVAWPRFEDIAFQRRQWAQEKLTGLSLVITQPSRLWRLARFPATTQSCPIRQ